jgi:hypothetical protein
VQHIKKITRQMINILGGAAVIGNYGYGFLAHPNVSPVLSVGAMQGISVSLESITRLIAPQSGGFLLSSLGAWTSGAVSAGLMLWVVYLAFCQIVKAEAPVVQLAQEVRYA